MSYRGDGSLRVARRRAHKAVLKAEGREVRGQGNVTALITATLSPSPAGTRVVVATDLSVTGSSPISTRTSWPQAFGQARRRVRPEPRSAVRDVPETVGSESAAEAEIDQEVAAYKAEIDDEVAADVVEAEEEAISKVTDSDDAPVASVTYLPTVESAEGRESLLRRLTPYLTVAGLLLIARIVFYSLRRRRR